MKKCASCTKDLPDAALHCVFCGAKQPPAPAVQAGLARTAFEYGTNAPGPLGTAPTMIDTARAPARPSQPPPIAAPQVPPPMMPPTQGTPAAPSAPPPPAPLPFAAPQMPAPQMAPPPHRAPELVPAVSASAKTLYVAGPAPAAEQKTIVPAMAPRAHPASAPPPIAAHQATMIAPQPAAAPAGFQPPPPIAPSAGSHSVGSPAPPMAIPAALASPYQTSQTGIKGFRPVEPWRSSLRVHMLVWGLLLLAYLLAPVRTGAETTFAWQAIFDGAGWARLAAAAIAAIGLASLILSALPVPAAARGAIAAVLGLAGAALPIAASHELPEYRVLAPMIGLVLLVPGLVMRAAYRDAILPRLLITFGVAGMLVPFVLPIDGSLPLVTIFKAIIEAPTWQARVAAAEPLALIIILVMCLLAWLPAPITGGATLWAWVLILWPLIHWLIPAVVIGDPAQLPALVEAQPSLALAWVQGSSAGIGLGSAYLVLIGYGFAALIGKQLE